MDDAHGAGRPPHDEPIPSLEEVAQLDAYLDALAAERRPLPDGSGARGLPERLLAAQARLLRAGADDPDPQFLAALEQTVVQATPQRRGQSRAALSRGRFLGAAARTAAGVGLIGAGYEGATLQRRLLQPHELVAGPGRWYDIAAQDEVAVGAMKRFAAGGVLGYLINDGHGLYALSAVCTHMGCRLKPTTDAVGLRCLCHGSAFAADGSVVEGLAPSPLARIHLHIAQGRVYAQGTVEDL